MRQLLSLRPWVEALISDRAEAKLPTTFARAEGGRVNNEWYAGKLNQTIVPPHARTEAAAKNERTTLA